MAIKLFGCMSDSYADYADDDKKINVKNHSPWVSSDTSSSISEDLEAKRFLPPGTMEQPGSFPNSSSDSRI